MCPLFYMSNVSSISSRCRTYLLTLDFQHPLLSVTLKNMLSMRNFNVDHILVVHFIRSSSLTNIKKCLKLQQHQTPSLDNRCSNHPHFYN